MSTDQQQQQPRVALTQEEMRILMQCNRDAFWQRSLPLMIALGGSTHWLVKMGYLRPHPTRGSLFKVAFAACGGWILGKMSFRSECQRRILEELPNSRLADQLRNRGLTPSGQQPYVNRPTQPGSGPIIVPPPKQDVDFGPPRYDEASHSQTSTSTSGTTYDDLRRRHHQQALQQQQEQLTQQAVQRGERTQEPSRTPLRETLPPAQYDETPSGPRGGLRGGEITAPSGKKMRVNKYGDLIEEGE